MLKHAGIGKKEQPHLLLQALTCQALLETLLWGMIEQLFDFFCQIPSQDAECKKGNVTSLLLKRLLRIERYVCIN